MKNTDWTYKIQSWEEYFQEIGEDFVEEPDRPEFCNATLTIKGIVAISVYNMETNGGYCAEMDYEILNEDYRESVEKALSNLPATMHSIPNIKIAEWVVINIVDELNAARII